MISIGFFLDYCRISVELASNFSRKTVYAKFNLIELINFHAEIKFGIIKIMSHFSRISVAFLS